MSNGSQRHTGRTSHVSAREESLRELCPKYAGRAGRVHLLAANPH